ncbi:MAG TPA: peptidylprolyl isomerase [Alphaproteobacteria bacterium]|nr:peptidylprolyl isomerase [Alphaproteobacteria bacterium]
MFTRFRLPAAPVATVVAFTFVSASLLMAAPLAAYAQEDGVAAVVNGDKILTKDVDKAIGMLGLKGKEAQEVQGEVLNQIINEKLIEDAIIKANIEQNPEYTKRLDMLKLQLQRQVFLEEQIKDKITDKYVKAEYEKFAKQNKGKTEIRARHILVPSEQEALQVIKDLDGGADFVELAKKRSSDTSSVRGGDLGYFIKEEMVPEFSKEAFALKTGSYSKKPVKTQFGWHVVKVEDKRDRAVPKYEQVAEPIRQKLGNDAVRKMVEGLRKSADVKILLGDAGAKADDKAAKKN